MKICKNLLFILFISIFVGCSSNKNIDSADKNFSNNNEIAALKKQDTSELFKNISTVEYDDKYKIIPQKLYNKEIYAYLVDKGNGKKYIGSINVSDSKLKLIRELDSQDAENQLIIHDINDNIIFYEEYNSKSGELKFYFYDISSDVNAKIFDVNNIPNIHKTYSTIYKKHIYFSTYNGSEQALYDYNLEDKSILKIKGKNTGYPIVFNNSLYYVNADSDKKVTQVEKVDLSQNKYNPEIVYKLENSDSFIFGLYTNGKDLLYSTYDNKEVILYNGTDFNNMKSVYKTTWVENLEYKNEFITFLGDKKSEEKVKPQYYLLDIKNGIDYDYNDGAIKLSDSGIAFIKYKQSEKDIKKGETFNKENSSIVFKAFNNN